MNDRFDIKKPQHLIALFVVLFILLAIPVTVIQVLNNRDNRSQAALTTNISISPSTQSANVNANFSVQVRENSGTTPVTTADITLSYDATRLDFVSVDPIPTGQTTGFNVEAVTPTGGAGSVNFIRFVNQVDGQAPKSVTGDQLIATVRFRAKTLAGATQINIANSSVVYGANGTDETNNRIGGTVTVVDPVPTVNITAPANNSHQRNTVLVTADATDNLGVTKVEFLVDGVLQFTDNLPDAGTNRYSYSMNTNNFTNATHTVTAKAFDASCTTSTCPTSNITVTVDNLPPAITLSGLPAKVRGNSTVVTANATDTNIDRVEFRVDSGAITTDNTSPFTHTLNTTTLSNGTHTFTATAFDRAGNSTPASQSFVADNQGPTSFTLSGSSPSQTQIDLTWTASTDALSGPVTYDVYRDGTKITPTPISATSYQATGLLAGTNYNFLVKAIDTLGNTTDSNTALIGTKAPVKPGDINQDGSVNSGDLAILLSTWGSTTDLRADLSGDLRINSADLARLISLWGS